MITKYSENCIFCGKPKEDTHHLVFGTGLRKPAERWNLTCPVCRKCHELIHGNVMAEKLSKICGQLLFEKEDILRGESEESAREHFRQIFSRSYL